MTKKKTDKAMPPAGNRPSPSSGRNTMAPINPPPSTTGKRPAAVPADRSEEKRQVKRSAKKELSSLTAVAAAFAPSIASPPPSLPNVKNSLGSRAAAGLRRLMLSKKFIAVALIVAYVLVQRAGSDLNLSPTRVFPSGLTVEEASRPGLAFAKTEAVKLLRPLVVVPGFVSTGLEVWEGAACIRSNVTSNFRQRVFGASMLLTLLQNPECFLQHLALDPKTLKDPPGIHIRPATGLDAVDFLIPGFWVWAKVLRSLSDIGYDASRIEIATFDWRLSPEDLERRDRYFTRLRRTIENFFNDYNMKVAVASHSYGGSIFATFLSWVEQHARKGWTEKYVHSFINIGGPLSGLPKATAGLVSGEVKDTAMLPSVTKMLLNAHVSRASRARTFRSWTSLVAMQPRGPAALWPALIEMEGRDTPMSNVDVGAFLVGEVGADSSVGRYLREQDVRHHYVAPQAPSMTMYCIYGVGKDTETGFHYEGNVSVADEAQWIRTAAEGMLPTGTLDALGELGNTIRQLNAASLGGGSRASPATAPLAVPPLDADSKKEKDPDGNPEDTAGRYRIKGSAPNNGIVDDDGDGTVPLLSLGYLCRTNSSAGWRHRVNVVTVEVPHRPAPVDPRGGTATADHVDILGNYEAINLLLRLLSGNEGSVVERVHSNVDARVAAADARIAAAAAATDNGIRGSIFSS